MQIYEIICSVAKENRIFVKINGKYGVKSPCFFKTSTLLIRLLPIKNERKDMRQEYARIYTEMPERKNPRNEASAEVSNKIDNSDIQEQYTIKL